jgi:hypothetical protein
MGEKGKSEDHEHSVGYKKPPKHAQFQPGQSGNPKGRPKRVPTVDQIFLKELQTRVSVMTTQGRKRHMSKLEALVKQLLNKALSGDPKAARFVLDRAASGKPHSGDNLENLIQELRIAHSRYDSTETNRPPSGKKKPKRGS